MSTLPASILSLSPTLARRAAPAPTTMSDAMHQWAQRPEEQRYWTLDEAAAAAEAMDARLALRDVTPSACMVGLDAQTRPALIHRVSGNTATLAPLAFQQLARAAGAPAGYLSTLTASLASKCLQEGWEARAPEIETLRLQTLDAGSGAPSIRAITSPSHDLTHNSWILRRLAGIVAQGNGFRVPPARAPDGYTGQTRTATDADCLKHAGHPTLAVQAGTIIAPSGVYLSDRDCFVLMVDDTESGQLDAQGDPLHRFIQISNSETGTGALDVTSGWLRSVCGNHILWGTQDIIHLRAIHRGENASKQVWKLAHQIEARGWTDDRAQVCAEMAAAKVCMLAKNKADLIDLLFAKKITSRQDATDCAQIGYELASIDGEPLSAWNVTQALTRMSQTARYASDRAGLDRSAQKVQQLAAWN